jgi:tetratricopeptide (TPR) repeat protein
MLGEFFYDYSEFSQAIRYLEEVGPNSPDTAKAHYLTGLVQVREKLYRSAVDSFQNSILASERNMSSREVSDIAYLALARIAYETGEYDAAIYYYRKVSQDSTKLPQAFYESAWTYFVKGDYSRALGTFQALHSPVFSHYYYPELWVLESTIYLNLCHMEKVQAALKMFNSEVTMRMGDLEGFLRKFRRPSELFNAVVDTMNKVNVSVDKVLLQPVLADVDFFNLYRTIRQIDRELTQLEADRAALGNFGDESIAKLKTLRDEKILEIGTRIQRRLKETQDQMAEYAVKVTEIEVELDQLVIESKMDELAALGGAEAEEKVGNTGGGAAFAIVGADSMQWPFEAEYWVDEIGAYRAFITERCSK